MGFHNSGGGGGEKLVETVLWTNSSPTSDFAAQDVTLSDAISNYTSLKFLFRYSTSITTENFIITTVDNIKARMVGIVSMATSTSVPRSRQMQYVNDTSFHFSPCIPVREAQSSLVNGELIPIKIIGIY